MSPFLVAVTVALNGAGVAINLHATLDDERDCAIVFKSPHEIGVLQGAVVHRGNHKWDVCVTDGAGEVHIQRNLFED